MLTDFGIELAELSRDGFFTDQITFDRIYTSPYIRARKTAEIIAEKTLPGGMTEDSFRVDARIREMCFGKYEGLLLRELKYKDQNIVNCFSKPTLFQADETGETYEEVFARIDDFMENELRSLRLDNVLVLCHGTVIRAFLSRINGTPLDDFWKMKQPNCCINKVEYKDGVFTSIRENILYYESDELMHRGIL